MTSRPLWDRWPPEVVWRPVSPRLVGARLVRLAVVGLPVLIAATGLPWLWWGSVWGIGSGSVVAVFLAVQLVLIPRRVRSWGYAERDDDLIIRHGVLTRRLSIVPYGRMQFIDISANPLERTLGLATVKLHTASALSDSTVPGLSPADATGLRDRLADRASTEAEGL